MDDAEFSWRKNLQAVFPPESLDTTCKNSLTVTDLNLTPLNLVITTNPGKLDRMLQISF
jgi:hypothetical protein